MTVLVEMVNEDYKGSTLQLSGPRTYLVDQWGKVSVDRKNVLELMNIGFWPVAQQSGPGDDYNCADDEYEGISPTLIFNNNLL